MHHTKRLAILGLFLAMTLPLGACGTGSAIDDAVDKPEMAVPKGVAKADAWHRLDDPSRLDGEMVMQLESLPLNGEAARIPWAGSYWPTFRDSINHRWDGDDSLSPSEKYAKAFDIDPAAVEDYVSETHGIDAHTWKPSCQSNSDCTDGTCAIRRGAAQGRCIPTWWGICHAWSPAAIAEPEPVRPLTVNGVTFKINDLKALATFAYNFIHTKYVSLRCEVDGSGVETDAYGNPTGADEPCKDTNPGTFHVVTTNFLGLRGESFVEDRTWDLQVWNQPVARYDISHQEDVSVARAHELLDVTDGGSAYHFNDAAKHLVHVRMGLDYVAESAATSDGNFSAIIEQYIHTDNYEYVLELDSERNIIGGEWVGASKTAHPDFLWVPTGFRIFQHYEPPIASWRIHNMMRDASEPETQPETQPEPAVTSELPTSPLNLDDTVETGQTKRFGPYETTGSITVALTGTGDADLYVRREAEPTTNVFDCRPFTGTTNERCDLDGGGRYYVAVYGYETSDFNLAVTLTESGDTTTPTTTTTPSGDAPALTDNVIHEAGSVLAGAETTFGPYTTESATLEVTLSGTGDADLFVRQGSMPTVADYDCRPYLPDSQETCVLTGPGTFYVMVSGYTDATFDLSVAY